jgi:hypothetical protein
VRERPLDGSLPELAILLVDVRTTAVLEIAGDRVVVVAVDRRDRALGNPRADLVGMRAVPDEIAAAVEVGDAELIDPRQRAWSPGRLPWISVMIATRSAMAQLRCCPR